MNLIDFIPMFIRQDENMRPKGVVTAARWNELWDLAILQGDHSEEAIQTLVAEVLNRYTKLESDALLAGNTNDLVKTVDVNLTTGVIGKDISGPLDCIRRVKPEIAACNAGSLNYLKIKEDGKIGRVNKARYLPFDATPAQIRLSAVYQQAWIQAFTQDILA